MAKPFHRLSEEEVQEKIYETRKRLNFESRDSYDAQGDIEFLLETLGRYSPFYTKEQYAPDRQNH